MPDTSKDSAHVRYIQPISLALVVHAMWISASMCNNHVVVWCIVMECASAVAGITCLAVVRGKSCIYARAVCAIIVHTWNTI